MFAYFVFVHLAPSIAYFEPWRINATHFNVSIGLKSTGGGRRTTFKIRARVNPDDWPVTPLAEFVIESLPLELEWKGIIFLDTFQRMGPLQFELVVENGVGFRERGNPVNENSG